MKFCPECGSKLMKGAKFCPECGNKLIAAISEESEKKKVSSEEYVLQTLNKFKDIRKDLYIGPDIPTKMLINAARSIAGDINPKLILGVLDTSVLGNGKDGIVFTGTKIYLSSIEIELEKIKEYIFETEVKTDGNGQTKNIDILKIFYDDGKQEVLSSEKIKAPLAIVDEILRGIKDNVETYESSNQMITLSELKDETISAYLKIVINYLKADDGIIDPREYKELISLMTRIKTSKEVHKLLQEYRFSQRDVVDFKTLVADLELELKKEKVSIAVVFQALFMDLLLMRKENLDNWREDPILEEMKMYLNVNDKQIDFLIRKIKLDEQILNTKIDDKQISGMVKELTAVAGGGGIALGALALTGSVMGAGFGVSSGLLGLFMASAGGATLGLLAVAGAGYGAYRGVKYFAGTSELEGYGMRISMLKETINRKDAANIYIIEDINYLGEKLGVLSSKIKETESLNNEILEELQLYIAYTQSVSESGELIKQDSQNARRAYWIQNLPARLDVSKYNELVENNVNKFDINILIFHIYDTNNEFILQEDCETEEYEKAVNVLKEIGYFDTTASTVAQAKGKAKQGWSSLKKGLQQELKDDQKIYSVEDLPEKLDIQKYSELLENNEKKSDIDDLIYSVYDADNGFVLMENCEEEKCERTVEILKEIGYFSAKTSTVEQAKNKAKQGWSKLTKGLLG